MAQDQARTGMDTCAYSKRDSVSGHTGPTCPYQLMEKKKKPARHPAQREPRRPRSLLALKEAHAFQAIVMFG